MVIKFKYPNFSTRCFKLSLCFLDISKLEFQGFSNKIKTKMFFHVLLKYLLFFVLKFKKLTGMYSLRRVTAFTGIIQKKKKKSVWFRFDLFRNPTNESRLYISRTRQSAIYSKTFCIKY